MPQNSQVPRIARQNRNACACIPGTVSALSRRTRERSNGPLIASLACGAWASCKKVVMGPSSSLAWVVWVSLVASGESSVGDRNWLYIDCLDV